MPRPPRADVATDMPSTFTALSAAAAVTLPASWSGAAASAAAWRRLGGVACALGVGLGLGSGAMAQAAPPTATAAPQPAAAGVPPPAGPRAASPSALPPWALPSAASAPGAHGAMTKPATGAAARRKTAATPVTVFDLNTATAAQLRGLPGGSADEAQRLIAHRPYLTKTEIVTKAGLPAGRYVVVRDHLVALPPGRPARPPKAAPTRPSSPPPSQVPAR